MTISTKGLDYAVVFVLDLDYLTPNGWTDEQITNLVYVGITRARYQPIIPHANQTPLIERLQSALERAWSTGSILRASDFDASRYFIGKAIEILLKNGCRKTGVIRGERFSASD